MAANLIQQFNSNIITNNFYAISYKGLPIPTIRERAHIWAVVAITFLLSDVIVSVRPKQIAPLIRDLMGLTQQNGDDYGAPLIIK